MTAAVAWGDVEVGTELPAQSFPVQRVDLVKYAGASGDFNVIHWNERVATVRRPAQRHRPRDVHDGRGHPRRHRLGRRSGCGRGVRRALHPPRRRARTTSGRDDRGQRQGHGQERRRNRTVAITATSDGVTVPGQGAGARSPGPIGPVGRLVTPCAASTLAARTTLRLGGAGARLVVRRRPRTRSSRRVREATPRGAGARPRRRQQRRRRRRRVPGHGRAGRQGPVRRRRGVGRGGALPRSRRASDWDDGRRPRGRAGAGRASRPLRHPRARRARRRSRTSAPTGRRSPRRSSRCARWTGATRRDRGPRARRLRLRLPHERVQARPAAYVVLAVTFELARGPTAAPSRYAELARSPRRRGRRRARRSATCATPSSRCAAARAWCSTRPTTTRGAPARSSRTRRGRRAAAERPRRARRRFAAARRQGQDVARPGSSSRPGSHRGHVARAGFAEPGSRPSTRSRSRTPERATAADVLELAREIQTRVHRRFGMELQVEVGLVGCALQGVGP